MDYKIEYEKAVDEIKILKVVLSKVCGYEYNEELPITLSLQQLTLENEILYCRIKKLETMLNEQIKINQAQQLEIVSLKEENKILKEEIKELKADNKSLHDKVDILLEKEEYNNLIIAIQDINRIYSLEYKLKNSSFTNLRTNRNDNFHYILDNDSQELKDAKITVLYERLQNMKNSIRKKMNRQYPNVIQDVLSEIAPVQPLSDKVLEKANDWWD